LKFPIANGRRRRKTNQVSLLGIRLYSLIFSQQETAPQKAAAFPRRQSIAPSLSGNHEKGAKQAAIKGL